MISFRLKVNIFFLILAVCLYILVYIYNTIFSVQYYEVVRDSSGETLNHIINRYYGALNLNESLEVKKLIDKKKIVEKTSCERWESSWHFKNSNDDLIIIQEKGCMLYNNQGFEIDSSSLERIKELIKSKVDNDELVLIR